MKKKIASITAFLSTFLFLNIHSFADELKNNPKTGDTNTLLISSIVAIVALIALLAINLKGKKKEENKKNNTTTKNTTTKKK